MIEFAGFFRENRDKNSGICVIILMLHKENK